MPLYRIELDALGSLSVFRLRHATDPNPKEFVYGLRGGLVIKPKNDYRHDPTPRPMDIWFEGIEGTQLCYTMNSVLVDLIREFKRRFTRAQRNARRERQAELTREMQRLLKEVLTVSRAHT